MRSVLVVVAVVGLSGSGCGDEGSGEPAVVACDPSASGLPVGCVYGKLVSPSGKPLAGVKIGACTGQLCITGNTSDAGTYSIQGLAVVSHGIKVFGEVSGHVSVVWWQDVEADVQSRLPQSVVLHPSSEMEKTPLGEAAGGTVLLADGQLEIEAQPDSLRYPLGTPAADELIGAIELDIDDLPPYDIEPWAGKESASRAFAVNPFGLASSTSLKLRVFGEDDVAVGTMYTVYAADHLEGRLEEVGMMRADGSGALVSEPGGSIKDLTTLIVVPN